MTHFGSLVDLPSPDRHDGPRLRVVRDRAGFEALRASWGQLLAQSADASPYLSWEWADAWLRSFPSRDRLHVVVVEREGEVVGLLPLLRCAGSVRPVLEVYVGLGQESSDYSGALLGEMPELTGPLLVGHVDDLVERGAVVVLHRVPPKGDWLPALRRATDRSRELVVLFEEEYPYLELEPQSEVQAHLRKAWKKNGVKRRLALLEQESEVDFEWAAEDTSTALEDFFRLHDLRWRQKQVAEGARPAGLFATEQGRRFLREVAEGFDQQGWLRLSAFVADGAAVARRVGFELAGRYYGVKSAFDPARASFGPGHLITGHVLQAASDRGLAVFDFMRGDGAHKHAWTTSSRRVPYLLLRQPGRRGRGRQALAWQLLRLRNRLRFA